MFETTEFGICFSRCATCGTICNAVPIVDMTSISYYAANNCTRIIGDLILTNIPQAMSDDDLMPLISVESIEGALVIRDNYYYMTTLRFLANLRRVHSITIANTALVDARLPNLQIVEGAITINNCYRLCPQRYPSTTVNDLDQSTCANITSSMVIKVLGRASLSSVELGGIISKIRSTVTVISDKQVRLKHNELLLLF